MIRRQRFLSPQERVNSPPQAYMLPQKSSMKQVGGYLYDQSALIGRGQFSTVHRGYEILRRDNLVAVKVINMQHSNVLHQALVENELAVLKRLDHPNLLKLLYSKVTANQIYIVTPYSRKGDLYQQIQRGVIPDELAIQYTLQMAKGLEALHSLNIMHGDIKSTNILVGDSCVLADFGFAQQLDKVDDRFLLGTPVYMAPELLFNSRCSLSADIWSLGCVLYEMVFGVPPFFAEQESHLRQQLQLFCETEQLKFPKTGVSRKVQGLIQMLLKAKPEERLSATDLKELLEPRSLDQSIEREGKQISGTETPKKKPGVGLKLQRHPLQPQMGQGNNGSNKIRVKGRMDVNPPEGGSSLGLGSLVHSEKLRNTSLTRQIAPCAQQHMGYQLESGKKTPTTVERAKVIELIDLVKYFHKIYLLANEQNEKKLAFLYLKLANIYYMFYVDEQSRQQRKVQFIACQNDYFELEKEIKAKHAYLLKEEEFNKVFYSRFALTYEMIRYLTDQLKASLTELKGKQLEEKVNTTLSIFTMLLSTDAESNSQLDALVVKMHKCIH